MVKERVAYILICMALIITAIFALMLGVHKIFRWFNCGKPLMGDRPEILSTVLNFRLPRILAAMVCVIAGVGWCN